MIEHLKTLCKYNNIKISPHHESKWCIEGDSGIVARCLRGTRATKIIANNLSYDLEEVCKYIEKKFDIKFLFDDIQ